MVSVVDMLVVIQCSVLVIRSGCTRGVVVWSSMSKVLRSFIYGGCLGLVTGAGRAGADVGINASLELVDGFCCLGGNVGCRWGLVAAPGAGVWIGWSEFRQLVPLLTNKDVSLMVRGRLWGSFVRSGVLHGGETWPVGKESVVALRRAGWGGWMDVWH